jgi:hypothetical protein
MIEQGLLVFEQPVVTAIQLVDFGQPEVFAVNRRGIRTPFRG